MSALGQKQTFAVQKGMSALPPIADMCGATRDIRFVPIADSEEMSGCAATAGERVASRSAWVLQRSAEAGLLRPICLIDHADDGLTTCIPAASIIVMPC